MSDGAGAMEFFNILISKYISLVKHIPEPVINWDAPFYQRIDDSYNRYYSGKTCKTPEIHPACRIQGLRYGGNFLRNITRRLPLDNALALAGQYGTSLTVLPASCLIYAIGLNVTAREKRKPIVLSVPVDLRNFFDSSSARNFFSTVRLSYVWSHKHNIWAKLVPLSLKNFALRFAYRNSMRGVTATISNIGRFKQEYRFSQHIKVFDICASTNKFQASVCSFGDMLSIGCTTPYKSSDIERTFFRIFSEKNIPVTIMSNVTEEPYI